MYTSQELQTNEFDKYDEPRLHTERLLRAHLVEFDLPLRILILLESANVKTIGDLVKKTREELLNINQFGCLSIEKLESFLRYHDLSLS